MNALCNKVSMDVSAQRMPKSALKGTAKERLTCKTTKLLFFLIFIHLCAGTRGTGAMGTANVSCPSQC